MINAVIFDMDGVVIDSEKYWPEANYQYLSGFFPAISRDEITALTGMGFYNPYDILKQKYVFDRDKESFARGWLDFGKETVYSQSQVIAGCRDFLFSARRHGKKTALATSSSRDIVERIFSSHPGMADWFDAVTSGDEVTGRAKPFPDLFLKAAQKLAMPPEACLVIEDANSGITAAKAAGMRVYGFRNGFNDHQSLKDADLVFDDFSAITL